MIVIPTVTQWNGDLHERILFYKIQFYESSLETDLAPFLQISLSKKPYFRYISGNEAFLHHFLFIHHYKFCGHRSARKKKRCPIKKR